MNIVPFMQSCCVREFLDENGETHLDFWVPVRTGDWATDNVIGREYSRRFVDHMAASGSIITVLAVLKTIITKGNCGPVEIGLLTALLEQLAALR